ncbi:MAG: ferrochelatase, partial [Phycisphaerae bacterium]|nr:ferrochelatase [Phycisphaerae bacterium]
QSRSGPPQQTWLEPDICQHLQELHRSGVQDVVISPIGFISDHMEILYDLDTEACALARDLGMNVARMPTVGTHPQFVSMIRELILERIDGSVPRRFCGQLGLSPDECPDECCPPAAAYGVSVPTGATA